MDAGYRDAERPDVFVVPLDPHRDPFENLTPPLGPLRFLFGRKPRHPPLHVEISADNLRLRATENRDVLGDRNAGTLTFSPVCIVAPNSLDRCPGWFMQHRGGTQLVATYIPELLFPGAPFTQHVVAYWLGSGDFRAIRSALYPT